MDGWKMTYQARKYRDLPTYQPIYLTCVCMFLGMYARMRVCTQKPIGRGRGGTTNAEESRLKDLLQSNTIDRYVISISRYYPTLSRPTTSA